MNESIEAPAKPIIFEETKKVESRKILESKAYDLSFKKNEYELTINIYSNSFIEFKLIQKNVISSSYYIEEYNLETINKLSFLFCKEIKEVFQFYNKILQKNKIKLLYLKEKNKFCLNFKNIINFDEEIEINIELKEVKLNKDDIFQVLINEVILLKKEGNKNENNEKIIKEINLKIEEIKTIINIMN